MHFPGLKTRRTRCLKWILPINPNNMPQKWVSRSIVNLEQFSNLLMQTTTKRKSVSVSRKQWKARSIDNRENMDRKEDITDTEKSNSKLQRSLKFHKTNFVQSIRTNHFFQQSRCQKDSSLI